MKLIQKYSTSSGILAGKPASNAGQFTRWADDDCGGDDHDRVGDDHDAQFSSGDQMLIAINF